MSGGSLDYVYSKVDEAAGRILERARTPLEKAFARHLRLVAEASRSLEWEYSGDGDSDCDKNIRAVVSRSDELRAAIAAAEVARKDLTEVLASSRKKGA